MHVDKPEINVQTSERLWEQDFRALLHENSIGINHETSIVHKDHKKD